MTIHQLGDVDPYSVRVSVYHNRSRGGWSVKTAERVGNVRRGKVIAHADALVLVDAVFEVNAAGIAAYVNGTGRRNANGRKRNVFARVTGKLADGAQVTQGLRRVTLRPDERPDFYAVDDGQTADRADVVVFDRQTDPRIPPRCYAGGLR